MIYAIYFERKNLNNKFVNRDIHLATSIEELNKIIKTYTQDKSYLAEEGIAGTEIMGYNKDLKMFWKEL